MSHPLVTVVIPAYNQAPRLPETLASVFAQTYDHLEIIVVDDASTDGTPEVMESYLERVRYLRQSDNRGPGATRNVGFRQASGEFIALLDGDDLWEPTKIEKQLQWFEDHPGCDFLFTRIGYFRVGADGTRVNAPSSSPIPEDLSLLALTRGNFICTSSVMMRRSVLERVGLMEERLRRAQDYHWWLRIAATCRMCYLPERLVWYRFHDDNLTGTIPEKTVPAILQVWDRLEQDHPDLWEHLPLTPAQTRANALMYGGRVCANGGLHFQAARLYLRSFLQDFAPRTLLVAGMAVLRGMTGARGKDQQRFREEGR